MDPFTFIVLAAAFAFVVIAARWLGAGLDDSTGGLFGLGETLDRPRGVQETDVPRFRIDPLIHPV
jgi:hypothetical protein